MRTPAKITAAASAAALALAACGGSHPAPPKLSAACSTAVSVAHYIAGTNGTQDPQNDLKASVSLLTAHWATAQEKIYAAGVITSLDPSIQGGGAEGLDPSGARLKVTGQLLEACQDSPAH